MNEIDFDVVYSDIVFKIRKNAHSSRIRNYFNVHWNTFEATRRQQNFPQDVMVGDISGLA